MKKDDFESFIFFGHTIDQNQTPELFATKIIDINFNNSKELIVEAKKLWDGIIEDNLSKIDTSKIMIPLSGGLDSRLILASIMKFIEPKKIHTYTFGTESSLDYKIGNLVAKKTGTNHKYTPCLLGDYTYKNEVEWAKRLKTPTTLFYHPPISIINEFNDFNYWFGYMGDPLAGSHLFPKIDNVEYALDYYLSKYGSISTNKAIEYNIDINSIKEQVRNTIQLDKNINIFENIDFSVRQHQYIRPHVAFAEQSILPFIDQRWIDFMLNLPNELRVNEVFYRQFMQMSYPKIFELPCKNNLGYKLGSKMSIIPKIKMKLINNQKDKMLNYIDFNKDLRNKNNLSDFVKEILFEKFDSNYLSKNQIDKIWKDFLNNEIQYGFILNLVSSFILNEKQPRK
jgi:hypothetical protein